MSTSTRWTTTTTTTIYMADTTIHHHHNTLPQVVGLLVRLKNITNGSKSPRLVRKAAFHSSPSFMRTLLKPHRTSSFVKYLTPQSFSINSEMSGSGYLFFTVMAFRAR